MNSTYKIPFLLFFFSFIILSAQRETARKKVETNEKRAEIQKMSSEQKMKLYQNLKQDLVEEELEIPEKNKQEFSTLYSEYQNSQRNIKTEFQPRKDFENMTDEEAVKELDASFEVGQNLLDNKKEYSKKFQKVMKPQQVLELFQNEGKMRAKVRERNQELQNGNPDPSFRNQNSEGQNRNSQNRQKNSSQGRR